MNKIIVFANDSKKMKELCAGAKQLGGKVVLITSREENGLAEEVWRYDAAESVAVMLDTIVGKIKEEAADLVLCEKTSDGRLVAGYAAAKLGISPMTDASSLEVKDNTVEITKMVYGGAANMVERAKLPAVVMVGAGVFEADDTNAECTVNKLEKQPMANVELVGVNALEAKTMNLAVAKRLVAVGRGIGEEANVAVAEKLAGLLGAELGCTRPIAEEEHWLPKERYVGVSGVMLKPNFYLALGISGQIQHMVGVNSSSVIFSVNKDENAPILQDSDYTLIGDVTKIMPALIEKLSE